MSDFIEKKEYGNGVEIHISYDTDSNNPREYEEKMWTIFQGGFRRHSIGDIINVGDSKEICDANFNKHLKEQGLKRSECIILPLYLFQHGSVKLELAQSCRWDSGLLGYVYISRDKIRKEYSVKRLKPEHIESAKTYLLGELERYEMYINGEVKLATLLHNEDEIHQYGNIFRHDCNDAINDAYQMFKDDGYILEKNDEVFIDNIY